MAEPSPPTSFLVAGGLAAFVLGSILGFRAGRKRHTLTEAQQKHSARIAQLADLNRKRAKDNLAAPTRAIDALGWRRSHLKVLLEFMCPETAAHVRALNQARYGDELGPKLDWYVKRASVRLAQEGGDPKALGSAERIYSLAAEEITRPDPSVDVLLSLKGIQ